MSTSVVGGDPEIIGVLFLTQYHTILNAFISNVKTEGGS